MIFQENISEWSMETATSFRVSATRESLPQKLRWKIMNKCLPETGKLSQKRDPCYTASSSLCLSLSLSLSVCAMELRLSTQVTVSMVAQYGSMGNKFTRCLEHVVCLRVFPSCTSVWVMMIWLTRAAPFIANKPMENKTSNRVDGFEWSG